MTSTPPTKAAAAEDCRTYVAAPPTSPCYQIFPGRRGGPLGRPYCSARTLTAGRADPEALSRPPCTGWAWEASFPSLVIIAGDEGNPTELVAFAPCSWFSLSAAKPRSRDVARGFALDPLTLVWDLSSITQPILDRLGCVSRNVPDSRRRPLPYALELSMQQLVDSRLNATLLFA